MNIPFLDLKWPHAQVEKSVKKRWNKILKNTAFVMGEDTKLFETNFAQYCQTKYCISVSNGTSALSLAIRALQLPAKSEIITLPTSFFASASSIAHTGHIPVFAEVDLTTGNFNYNKLQQAVTKKTKAIMAVHLYGRMCDMDKIEKFAKKNNLFIIEDAAQAHGATYKNKKAGSIGHVGCFSFYPGKNLGAYGDAGAVVTNSDEIALYIRKMREHGSIKKYEHELLGYNERMDNIQAPVLDEKLKHLDDWNSLRKKIATMYYKAFADMKDVSVISPDVEYGNSVYHLFPLRVKNRDEFMQKLKEKGVATSIHYPRALHMIPALQQSGCKEGDFPVAEKIARETVSIPIFPGMTKEQVMYVIKSIQEICK